jgi:hypothetical protein
MQQAFAYAFYALHDLFVFAFCRNSTSEICETSIASRRWPSSAGQTCGKMRFSLHEIAKEWSKALIDLLEHVDKTNVSLPEIIEGEMTDEWCMRNGKQQFPGFGTPDRAMWTRKFGIRRQATTLSSNASIRLGDATFEDAFVQLNRDLETVLFHASIAKLRFRNGANHRVINAWNLLLRRSELERLNAAIGNDGLMILRLQILPSHG